MLFVKGFHILGFAFFDKQWQPLPIHQRQEVHFIRITWRKQKNDDNGRHVTFGKAVDTQLCPVLAAIRIYDRALHIHHKNGL